MVSPLMENGNLKEYLEASPDADRLLLVTEIADGLNYLHTREPAVVHGDLKAANIFISKSGKPRIGDFGLSETVIKSSENSAGSNGNSSAFKKGGHPRWQAPEIMFNHLQRTTSTDVFAFGRVIYEVYAGTVPFVEHEEPYLGIYVAVRRGVLPPRPAAFSDEYLWLLMAHCCTTNPQERPSAQGIIRYLKCDDATRRGAMLLSLPHSVQKSRNKSLTLKIPIGLNLSTLRERLGINNAAGQSMSSLLGLGIKPSKKRPMIKCTVVYTP